MALAASGAVIALSVLAYIHAGMDYFMWVETTSEAIKFLFITYGEPVVLIFVG